MDDQTVILLGILTTLVIGLVGGVLTKKLRGFLKNVSDLSLALNDCLDEDCTSNEINRIAKELKETAESGLGIIIFFKGIIGK